jgi:hypothetical protein
MVCPLCGLGKVLDAKVVAWCDPDATGPGPTAQNFVAEVLHGIDSGTAQKTWTCRGQAPAGWNRAGPFVFDAGKDGSIQ